MQNAASDADNSTTKSLPRLFTACACALCEAALKFVTRGWQREIFMVLFLDNQHQVLQVQKMFSGSIASVEVYPREIVREALKLNAAAVILAHNHPSGLAEPSRVDRDITGKVVQACALLNIRLLDHLVY